jgi:ABC-2 type transport system permease protein
MTRNISADVIKSLETNINLDRIDWKTWPDQKADTTDMKRVIGYISGFMIYFFIFMFGAQVMQGVFEEKSSRIVEVIISSVRPFQLMMGKVVGVGLIGLTQFLVWIVLTIGITTVVQQIITPREQAVASFQSVPSDIMASAEAGPDNVRTSAVPSGGASVAINGIINQFHEVNLFFIIVAFIFYFLGGYLLYGALFAAIGAAVDSQSDTQQFMLPITIPLILGLMVAINSFTNPSNNLAVIFSIIPLTSPIVMMSRIPFGVPPLQLLASAGTLILTFLGSIWLAGKIYRTGILMYGKKVTYGELWKWIKYKN